MQAVAKRRPARSSGAYLVALDRVSAAEHDTGVAVGADPIFPHNPTRRLRVEAVAPVPERSLTGCVGADQVAGDRAGRTEQHPIAVAAADDIAGGKGAATQLVARAQQHHSGRVSQSGPAGGRGADQIAFDNCPRPRLDVDAEALTVPVRAAFVATQHVGRSRVTSPDDLLATRSLPRYHRH